MGKNTWGGSVPAQFGLGGLLWFMVACSAYFTQLAFVLKAGQVEESLSLPNMATVAIGWLLLAAFYLRIHFRLALVVHCAGLVTNLLVMVLMTPLWLFADRGILLGVLDFVRVLLLGCLVGSMISLPTAIVLMITAVTIRSRPGARVSPQSCCTAETSRARTPSMDESASRNSESPPGASDINTRGHCAAAPRQRREPRPAPVQFGLGGLLWFMLASSAYFAQLAVAANGYGEPGWPSTLGVMVGWLLMAAFYARIRFSRGLVIHGFAPAIMLCILFAAAVGQLALGQPPDARDIESAFEVLSVCCLISSLFSLPSFVLMMIVWGLARHRPQIR